MSSLSSISLLRPLGRALFQTGDCASKRLRVGNVRRLAYTQAGHQQRQQSEQERHGWDKRKLMLALGAGVTIAGAAVVAKKVSGKWVNF